jgi:hypothetical protein
LRRPPRPPDRSTHTPSAAPRIDAPDRAAWARHRPIAQGMAERGRYGSIDRGHAKPALSAPALSAARPTMYAAMSGCDVTRMLNAAEPERRHYLHTNFTRDIEGSRPRANFQARTASRSRRALGTAPLACSRGAWLGCRRRLAQPSAERSRSARRRRGVHASHPIRRTAGVRSR